MTNRHIEDHLISFVAGLTCSLLKLEDIYLIGLVNKTLQTLGGQHYFGKLPTRSEVDIR